MDKLVSYLVTVTNRQAKDFSAVTKGLTKPEKIRNFIRKNPSFFGCKTSEAKKILSIVLEVPVSFFDTKVIFPELGTIMFRADGKPVVHLGKGHFLYLASEKVKGKTREKLSRAEFDLRTLKYKVIKESDLTPYAVHREAVVKALRVIFI